MNGEVELLDSVVDYEIFSGVPNMWFEHLIFAIPRKLEC